MISRDGQEVGNSCGDEMFSHLLRNVSLFSQNQGLKNGRGWRVGFPFEEISYMIPPCFDPEEEGIFKSLPDFNPTVSSDKKSDGMNPFKGKMAFIGESARIAKSARRMKPAEESKAISYLERLSVLFEKKKEMAFNRDVAVRKNDLLGSDQKLGSFQGTMGRMIDDSLQCDSIETVEMGDVVRGSVVGGDKSGSRKFRERRRRRRQSRNPMGFFSLP